MDCYVYKSDLYCYQCTNSIREKLLQTPDNGKLLYTKDSDAYPQFVRGEDNFADSPQHCRNCKMFLENPLTVNGLRCVMHMISRLVRQVSRQDVIPNKKLFETIKEYVDFYGINMKEFLHYLETC